MLILIGAIVVALIVFSVLRALAGPIVLFVCAVLALGWWDGTFSSDAAAPAAFTPVAIADPVPARVVDGSSCPGISADDVIQGVTLHGFRYGGPHGPVVQAEAVQSMRQSGGYCLARVGLNAGNASLPDVAVAVTRRPDGSLQITSSGYFAD